MYVLVAYDVEARRTGKFRKLLSRYLMHEQNSVFSGDLPEARLRLLDADLGRLMSGEDRVFQVLAENRHNVAVKILRKADGNGAPVKENHEHHRTDAVVV